MKLTKYEHACLVLDNGQAKLVIDPGEFTELPDLAGVAAVVVTHQHPDHLSRSNLEKLAKANPGLQIYTVADAADQLSGLPVTPVTDSMAVTPGNFAVQLKAVPHAVIYGASPCQDLTVSVDGLLYYPGDSLAPADGQPALVALPIDAPWLKLSEAVDFIKNYPEALVVPTHNHLNSPDGNFVAGRVLISNVPGIEKRLLNLAPGQSTEL